MAVGGASGAIRRLSTPTSLVLVGAIFLPALHSPAFAAPAWSPKAAVLLAVGGAGTACLVGLARTQVRSAAGAAILFLGIAATATAFSGDPVASVVGLYNYGTGLVFLVCCAGVWALASVVPPSERRFVTWGLLVGIATSSLVAVLQVLDLAGGDFASGRAEGLAGNAVHLGTLAVGAAAIAAFRTRRSAAWAVAAGVAAVVVQLSGTRFALVVLAILTVAGALRSGPRAGLALAVAVLVGVGAGAWLHGLRQEAGTTAPTATSRISSVSSGSNVRVEVWWYSRNAIAERPLFGHGPARFRSATSADRSLASARAEGGETLYADAHNVVVEHLVTTGILGTVALLSWLALSARRATGDLAWFAFALGLMALVQPLNAGATPLLFLSLGAAGSVDLERRVPRGAAVSGLLGVVLATILLVGDQQARTAITTDRLAPALNADRWLRPWPEPATLVARAIYLEDRGDPSVEGRVLSWYRSALRRDRTDPRLANLLADEERAFGLDSEAERHYELALAYNPYSTVALTNLAELAHQRGDDLRAVAYLRRAIEVRAYPELERLLAQLE